MKRSEALRALSHHGRPRSRHAQVFLDFYEREGSRHFRAEEELLLPALARHTRVDDPAIVRVLTEHIDIRRRRQDLDASVDPDPVELRELGERLESHIRFEERVLSR